MPTKTILSLQPPNIAIRLSISLSEHSTYPTPPHFPTPSLLAHETHTADKSPHEK